MDQVYTSGPTAVPPDFTKPTTTYRNRAWLALGGLALFVLAYFALSSTFTWVAYRLLRTTVEGGGSLKTVVGGVAAAFIAVFLWKALIFVKHRYAIDDIEISREKQPRLFAFIDQLADAAGAPRAHRVYLSARVNAAVSYDLSILNLIVPSKKNLEIGLALVNSLSLGEFKAVLAHEFGHFAQRSMAVGRWVYVAQQIATHIIGRRDAFDAFLRGLSRFDIRIAWVGWILSIIIWSLRSLMETVFRIVVLAHRALSREMEFQADLVAVSLTGSDALVHALYRLHAADDAWERTLNFANSEAHAGRAVSDLFTIQTQVLGKLRHILGDESYGDVVPLPQQGVESHRIFKTQLAQAPRMWSTHPANTEREHNAKRVYIPAQIDARSAWDLFDDAQQVRAEMSAHLFRNAKINATPIDESLQKLEGQYKRAFLDRSYRGAYLGRATTRHAKSWTELYNPPVKTEFVKSELAALYPESLADCLAKSRELGAELAQLEALQAGYLDAPDGVIRHRGKTLRRKDLAQAIEEVRDEYNVAHDVVLSHDRRCRTVHLSAAANFGAGWDAYLQGLSKILHYAEHAEANVRDAQGLLINVYSIVTADGRVSSRERRRLVDACVELHNALRHVYEDEGSRIALDRTLMRRMEIESWQKSLGDFNLPLPTAENVGQWLQVVDGWVNAATAALSALRASALEQLLLAESQIAKFVHQGLTPAAAPEPTSVPDDYPLLQPGSERKRQRKLDLWDRFHAADGLVPTLARLTVACGIVFVTLNLVMSIDKAAVHIYNGLGIPVKVVLDDQTMDIGAHSYLDANVKQDADLKVTAFTAAGTQIESFTTSVQHRDADYIYNVASAVPLVQWTAVYGTGRPSPEHLMGTTRWVAADADYFFEEPPQSIDTRSGGNTRQVISADEGSPTRELSMLSEESARSQLIETHARWDDSAARNSAIWLQAASTLPNVRQILEQRLSRDPKDVSALRMEQEVTKDNEHEQVCARHRALLQTAPNNGDLQYLAARCIVDETQRDDAFLKLHEQFPYSGWLAYAGGVTYAERARWEDARTSFEVAYHRLPGLVEAVSMDLARLRRVHAFNPMLPPGELLRDSPPLQYIQAIESRASTPDPEQQAYSALLAGHLEEAVRLTASQTRPRLLRLAAASDGASRQLVREALTTPLDQGLDANSVWSALGLALRERADTDGLVAFIENQQGEDGLRLVRVLKQMSPSQSIAQFDRSLDGLSLQLHAQAYSAGAVVLGERAPPEWRDLAMQLLFIVERPYFARPNRRASVLPPPVSSVNEQQSNRTLPQLIR